MHKNLLFSFSRILKRKNSIFRNHCRLWIIFTATFLNVEMSEFIVACISHFISERFVKNWHAMDVKLPGISHLLSPSEKFKSSPRAIIENGISSQLSYICALDQRINPYRLLFRTSSIQCLLPARKDHVILKLG